MACVPPTRGAHDEADTNSLREQSAGTALTCVKQLWYTCTTQRFQGLSTLEEFDSPRQQCHAVSMPGLLLKPAGYACN